MPEGTKTIEAIKTVDRLVSFGLVSNSARTLDPRPRLNSDFSSRYSPSEILVTRSFTSVGIRRSQKAIAWASAPTR